MGNKYLFFRAVTNFGPTFGKSFAGARRSMTKTSNGWSVSNMRNRRFWSTRNHRSLRNTVFMEVNGFVCRVSRSSSFVVVGNSYISESCLILCSFVCCQTIRLTNILLIFETAHPRTVVRRQGGRLLGFPEKAAPVCASRSQSWQSWRGYRSRIPSKIANRSSTSGKVPQRGSTENRARELGVHIYQSLQ